MSELRDPDQEQQRLRLRVTIAWGLVLVCFGILLSRFIWLQVVRHSD